MSQHEQPKPFRIEVVVEAARDRVWPALTDPVEIRRWFGWDYEGLDAEVGYIFVDHAEPVGPDRLQLDEARHQRSVAVERWGGGLVSLVTSEPRSSSQPARAQVTVTT